MDNSLNQDTPQEPLKRRGWPKGKKRRSRTLTDAVQAANAIHQIEEALGILKTLSEKFEALDGRLREFKRLAEE